jgi:hypothetical protein
MSTLLKVAVVVYTLATAATGGLTAYAVAVEAWPLALGLVGVWFFGWNLVFWLGYAELDRCRGNTGGAQGAGQAAQTSVGRHRADGPAAQLGDQVVEPGFVEAVLR